MPAIQPTDDSDSLYTDLLTTNPNSRDAREKIWTLSAHPEKPPYTRAKVSELEPFLHARSPDVREEVLRLLILSNDPGADGSRLLLDLASSEKNANVVACIYRVMGSYPELRGYLEEQCFKNSKPAAKCGCLSALGRMLGAAGTDFYAAALGNKKQMGGYFPRAHAADILMDYDDGTHIQVIASFVDDMLGYSRDTGYNSTFLKCIRFLHDYYPINSGLSLRERLTKIKEEPDPEIRKDLEDRIFESTPEQKRILDVVKRVESAWSFAGSISKEENWYLKEQYQAFTRMPIREMPTVYDLERLNEALEKSGIPRRTSLGYKIKVIP